MRVVVVQVPVTPKAGGQRRAVSVGVAEAPRHEVAGGWPVALQQTLLGFERSADVDGWAIGIGLAGIIRTAAARRLPLHAG